MPAQYVDDTERAPESQPAKARGWRSRGEVVALVAVAIATRLPGLGHTPLHDELYHVLAAKSLLANGTLELTAGAVPYTRGVPFTALVAAMFRLFGESFVTARIPSVVASVALTAALFMWVRRVSTRGSAWAAALLLCFYPYGILVAQFARFYALHALAFWVAAFAVYRLAEPGVPRATRAWLGAGAVAALALATSLQQTTAIGVLGLAVFLAGVAGPGALAALRRHRHRGAIAAAGLAVVALGWLVASKVGLVYEVRFLFKYVDVYNEQYRNAEAFYASVLYRDYGVLWPLFPAAALVAARRYGRATWLCVSVFGVALFVHSLAAFKAERFLYYAVPAFCAVWGLALPRMVAWVRAAARRVAASVAPHLPRRLTAALATVATGVVVLGAGAANAAFPQAYRMLTREDHHVGGFNGPYRINSDWERAAPRLRALADSSAFVIATADGKALYYLGRVDAIMRKFGRPASAEYGVDVGWSDVAARPLIHSADAMRRAIACNPSGLVVTELRNMGEAAIVSDSVAAILRQETDSVPMPREWRLRVFRWRHSPRPVPAGCPEMLVPRPGGQ